MDIKLRLLVSLTTAFFVTTGLAGPFGDKKVEWSQVPEKVQQTTRNTRKAAPLKKSSAKP